MIIPISITTIITVIKITEYTRNNKYIFVANSKSQCNKDRVISTHTGNADRYF